MKYLKSKLMFAALVGLFGNLAMAADESICGEYVTPKVAKKAHVSEKELNVAGLAYLGDGYLAMEIFEYRVKNKGGYFKADVMTDGCIIRRIEYIKP